MDTVFLFLLTLLYPLLDLLVQEVKAKNYTISYYIMIRFKVSAKPVLATGGKVRLRLRFFRIFGLRLG